MTTFLNHKFEIGQEVFYLDKENKCQGMTITSISPHIYKNKIIIFYYGEDMYRSFLEEQLYSSREDLAKHIFENRVEIIL